MESNPFADLISIMRDEGKTPSSFFMGEIIKPLPNIEINTQGLPLYKSDLMIDKWLYDRNCIGFECSSASSCPDDGGHKHTISTNPSLKDTLNPGDKVFLVCLGEKFLILSKVVDL